MKKVAGIFTFVLLMFALVTNANATTVQDAFFINEMNWLSDNSGFYLINDDGSTIDNQAGGVPIESIIEEGDRIRGMFEIATVEDVTGSGGTNYLGGGTGNNEFTGIYELVVTDITGSIFTMGASASFQTEMETHLGVGGLDGIAVSMFQSSTINYTRLSGDDIAEDAYPPAYDVSEEALIDNATDGSEFWSFGFVTADNYWRIDSDHPDIWDLKTGLSGSNHGTANLALDLIRNVSGIPLDPISNGMGGFADLVGSGDMKAIGGVNTPFDGWDNFDLNMKPIPEPATMFLLGSGLIGLVGYSRKKFKL